MGNQRVRFLPRAAVEDYQHFSIKELLPPGHTLVLNHLIGTCVQFCVTDNGARMLMEQQFTNTEMAVLVPLFEQFPYFCSYDVLHAAYNFGNTTESRVKKSRQTLEEAMQTGVWDQEMRPVRGAISRVRLKTHAFNIEISSIQATGYILMQLGLDKHGSHNGKEGK